MIDVLVLGAGVAGLACARELLAAGRSTVVVELSDEDVPRAWFELDLGARVDGDRYWWPVEEALRAQRLPIDRYTFADPLRLQSAPDGCWDVVFDYPTQSVRARELVVGTMGALPDPRELQGAPEVGRGLSSSAWADASFIPAGATVYVVGTGPRARDQVRWIWRWHPHRRVVMLPEWAGPAGLDPHMFVFDGREARTLPPSLAGVPKEGVWWASPAADGTFLDHAGQLRAGQEVARRILAR